jgi:hypothetical protein
VPVTGDFERNSRLNPPLSAGLSRAKAPYLPGWVCFGKEHLTRSIRLLEPELGEAVEGSDSFRLFGGSANDRVSDHFPRSRHAKKVRRPRRESEKD